jgi:hypothetical protein
LKLAILTAATALSAAASTADSASAVPQHLRYQRSITVPQGAQGLACAVLDAAVFAHAADRSLDDLRLYRSAGGGAPVETPFALTESEAQPADAAPASVQHLGLRGGDVVFDLAMPHRAYTAVDLQLAAKDFVATAKVSGTDQGGGAETQLGSFALFDLTGQGLSRSTELPLRESAYARLHVVLHMRTSTGAAVPGLNASIVQGATVPPSREAQTLYTPVAQATSFVQQGPTTLLTIPLPQHVPLERVSFALAPDFHRSFLRRVRLTMKTGATQNNSAVETVNGEISQVQLPEAVVQGAEGSIKQLGIDAVFAANLRHSAVLEVAIDNGDGPPLPWLAVQAQMRQRMVCFDAAPGGYTLRYGDNAPAAPVYDYAGNAALTPPLLPGPVPVEAVLGPELTNPAFVPREDERPYSGRHPETLWLALLVAVAAISAGAMQGVKRQGRKVQHDGEP